MGKVLTALGTLGSISFLILFTYKLISTGEIHTGAVAGLIGGLSLLIANVHLFQYKSLQKKENSIY